MSEKIYKPYSLLPKLRKWTVPVHWTLGFILAFVAWRCFPAALVVVLIMDCIGKITINWGLP